MSNNLDFGQCHICGMITKLTFEHVPPRKAFNDKPVLYHKIEEILGKEEEDFSPGRKSQLGVGAYTLCGKCNNDTGAWYGSAFVNWAWQGMDWIHASGGNSVLYLNFNIFPLRVIKQIICLFCSVNGSQWTGADLRRFLLNKKLSHIPGNWRVFAFFNTSPRIRQMGIVGQVNLTTNKIAAFSEITFPPFGYVITRQPEPPDPRLQDITFFGRYLYNDWKTIPLKLPLLPVPTFLSADYRTKEQVDKDVAENKRYMLEHGLTVLRPKS